MIKARGRLSAGLLGQLMFESGLLSRHEGGSAPVARGADAPRRLVLGLLLPATLTLLLLLLPLVAVVRAPVVARDSKIAIGHEVVPSLKVHATAPCSHKGRP